MSNSCGLSIYIIGSACNNIWVIYILRQLWQMAMALWFKVGVGDTYTTVLHLIACTCIALEGPLLRCQDYGFSYNNKLSFMIRLLKATTYNHKEIDRLVFSIHACAIRIFWSSSCTNHHKLHIHPFHYIFQPLYVAL